MGFRTLVFFSQLLFIIRIIILILEYRYSYREVDNDSFYVIVPIVLLNVRDLPIQYSIPSLKIESRVTEFGCTVL